MNIIQAYNNNDFINSNEILGVYSNMSITKLVFILNNFKIKFKRRSNIINNKSEYRLFVSKIGYNENAVIIENETIKPLEYKGSENTIFGDNYTKSVKLISNFSKVHAWIYYPKEYSSYFYNTLNQIINEYKGIIFQNFNNIEKLNPKLLQYE